MKDNDIIFQKKKIMVLGLGVTGIPVMKKLAGLGNDITGLDNNTSMDREKILSDIGMPERGKVRILLEKADDIKNGILEGIDLLITSPGIPSANKIIASAIETGIPVWDELELVSRLVNGRQKKRIIAVTGTNGKTTVVNLIGCILDNCGMDNMVCGNVGSPLLDTIDIDLNNRCAADDEIIRVVEVSSFQLERTRTFKPGVGVLLNITSDHMDRHGDIKEYSRLKMKLFSCQDSGDFAIINADDRIAFSMTPEIEKRKKGPRLVKYGLDQENDPGVWYESGNINYKIGGLEGKIDISGNLFKGMHNMSNAAASAAAALIMGADPKGIGTAIKNFKPLSHRMEYLGEVSGIRCINDSKSTNPDSVIAALRGFSKEVTIIMGGLDKDVDFTPVIPSLISSVKNIILIGRSASRMKELFSSVDENINIHICRTLEKAVCRGFEVTMKGDVLLLSPGCASMDMFKDYKDRGNKFKKAVMDHKHGS